MKKASPIVVGIDFSEASPFVLRQAVHSANLTGAPVVAVHVINRGRLQHWVAGDDLRDSHGPIIQEGERKMAALIQEHTPGADVEVCVRYGRPVEELDKAVRERKASRLIIAANDLTKKHLGSTASRCVRAVPSDVLIVRDWNSGNFKKVIVCTDFSKSSDRLLNKSIELAEVNAAELDFVHVIYPPDQDYWGESLADVDEDGPTYQECVRTSAKKKMEESLAGFSEKLEGVKYSSTILESAVPSVALTYHIKESGADLVVLGTREHSKLASIFVGTNAERLMHDATVSALAVRV